MELSLDGFKLVFGSEQFPYVFAIALVAVFDPILEKWLSGAIVRSLPPGYDPTDILNYAGDASNRLAFVTTLLGTAPYFLWQVFDICLPRIVIYMEILLLIAVSIGGVLALSMMQPPTLRTDASYRGWRRGVWLGIAVIIVNLLLMVQSAVRCAA
jgi:hypothetical protein